MRIRGMPKAFILVSLLGTSPCFGWGADGHRIVGRIAQHFLTPDARSLVDDLLAGQSLAEVSTWADEIKSDRKWDWARPMHYANVATGSDGFVLERDCPARGCVIRAILDRSTVLRQDVAGHSKQAQALRFLVHFVGDIHQPLHVSRAEDRGGNSIRVVFFGRQTNLHRVWDTDLIRKAQMEWREFADELVDSVTLPKRSEWGSNADPTTWADESWSLAMSHAYPIPSDGRIGDEYLARNIPVIKERLAMGGVRLAHLLNVIAAARSPRVADGPGARQVVEIPLPLLWWVLLGATVLVFAYWQTTRAKREA